MQASGVKKFKVSRNDYLYQFAHTFDGAFSFRQSKIHPYRTDGGVIDVQNLGFDFKSEFQPEVQIKPLSEEVFQIDGKTKSDFKIVITVLDQALKIRKVVREINAFDVTKTEDVKIDLESFDDLGFYRGFDVGVYVVPSFSDYQAEGESMLWSESQVVHSIVFECKASGEEALFNLTFEDFPEGKSNALHYVKWSSTDVSQSSVDAVVEIVINSKFQDAYLRLNANKKFGQMVLRQIFAEIMRELIDFTLRFADLDSEPLADTLHARISKLLRDVYSIDFDDLSTQMQSGNRAEELRVSQEVLMLSQLISEVGSELGRLEFGGYRGA